MCCFNTHKYLIVQIISENLFWGSLGGNYDHETYFYIKSIRTWTPGLYGTGTTFTSPTMTVKCKRSPFPWPALW
jgi:hypothetical protein